MNKRWVIAVVVGSIGLIIGSVIVFSDTKEEAIEREYTEVFELTDCSDESIERLRSIQASGENADNELASAIRITECYLQNGDEQSAMDIARSAVSSYLGDDERNDLAYLKQILENLENPLPPPEIPTDSEEEGTL